MRVVVTGAAGHLGANLVRALIAQGAEVRALVNRDVRALEGLPLERVGGDVLDPASLERAFRGATLVLHAAARIALGRREMAAAEAVNIRGTEHVVSACLSCGVYRLVHVSSVAALEQTPLDEPLDENRALAEHPDHDSYEHSKARAEEIVQDGVSRGLDAVTVNPSAIIGPNDFKPSAMGRLLLLMERGRMPFLVEGGQDFVDARDVATATLAAARAGRRGERYLISGTFASLAEIAALCHQVSGRGRPCWVAPRWLATWTVPLIEDIGQLLGQTPLVTRAALAALYSNSDIRHDKATRELGYAPRPLVQTLSDTLAWYREVGMLPARSGR